MTRGNAAIRKRGNRYIVTYAGSVIENTWDLRWALYRYALIFPTSKGVVLRALERAS